MPGRAITCGTMLSHCVRTPAFIQGAKPISRGRACSLKPGMICEDEVSRRSGMRAAVIGGGAWGTALASVLSHNGYGVTIWSFEAEVADSISERHENQKYLPGIALPPQIRGTLNLADALGGAELIIAANPSHVTRVVMAKAVPHLPRGTPIVSATKGIENDSLLTMDEVLEDVLPPEMHPYLAFLSGPSFAKETAQKMPTAVVIAATWERIAKQVQKAFSNDFFRCYTSNDVAGVELGGSLKNVCAIAAGIADGMGFGHNTRSEEH